MCVVYDLRSQRKIRSSLIPETTQNPLILFCGQGRVIRQKQEKY